MKRLLIILSAIVLLAGCRKDAPVDASVTMTYTLVPEVSFHVKGETQTPAISPHINTLSCLVYHLKNGEYEHIHALSLFVDLTDPSNIDNTGNIKVPVKLFKDQTYRLIFVAQHAIKSEQRTDSYVYNINNGVMRVNERADITSGDQLEAFAYVEVVTPTNASQSKHITLDRIVSQVNIGTSKESLPTTLKAEVAGTPLSYDIVNNTCSDETTTLTFDSLNVPGDEMIVSENKYNRLTTLYFLGSNKIDITLTKNTEETFTINQVSTKVNYKTNIAGNI